MTSVTTPALIYRLIQYSDKSAIALCFSRDYGKLKLFIPKAYSSKGGILTFVPGSISFGMKDSSDLHRFNSYSHDPTYYGYTQNPDIIMRLHLLFDFFETAFHPGANLPVLWKLILKYNDKNWRSLTLYSIYRILKEAGAVFRANCACGSINRLYLSEGELICGSCLSFSEKKEALLVEQDVLDLVNIFDDNTIFKNTVFSAEEERKILYYFQQQQEILTGKKDSLKSIKVFFSMM